MKTLYALILLAALALVPAVLGDHPERVLDDTSPAVKPTERPSHSPELADDVDDLLRQVVVAKERPDRAGYDRDCGRDGACSFGPAWSDDYDGPGGHDGCDTRNNVLQRDLVDTTFRPGTHNCVVISGQLNDPYTGATIDFTKQHASAVQIDHLYPLAAAWDMGAADWPLERRIQFANDVDVNLLAVDGRANASKGDRTPGEWLPISKTYACTYVTRFLRVAIAYDLPVTAADVDASKAACS